MRITSLQLDGFTPFKDTNLALKAPTDQKGGEVHLFVGENGTGKTRLLSLILAVLGNPTELKARLDFSGGIGRFTYQSLGKGEQHEEADFRMSHLSGLLATHPQLNALAFKSTASVSDAEVQAIRPVQVGGRIEHLTFSPHTQENHIIAQSMTNLKMATAMDMLQGMTDTRALRLVSRLERVISDITGRRFDFRIDPHPKVNICIRWGEIHKLRLAQAPDGLRAIIGTLAACAAKLEALNPDEPNPLDLPVILVLDEPETHLHPRWQRQILPGLQALLPNAQIFVATHSPFIISSVNSGWLHLLRPDAEGLVTVESQECSPGDSYLDVIETILGVSEWYDVETESLLAKFRSAQERSFTGDGEVEFRRLGEQLAKRSQSLADIVSAEIRQFERLKAQKAS